jgi:hypothetical protein
LGGLGHARKKRSVGQTDGLIGPDRGIHSSASRDLETRKLCEREFAYIDKISTTCRILTTAAEVGVAVYVPYPSIVAELGGGLAGQVLHYASALGVNLQTVGFDKHHICRLVRAGQALHRQTHSGVKRRLLQYGLCRPTDDACKARVRAVIFQR